ncbi:HAMP domain-containing sensor histidine kinase [uncultured Roseibium sp.]|uniref:sensor histidine kinase n=1 Tax=uncultured Roseibium sp. TaxID=1936171 RepID=UPI00321664A0
MHRADLFRSSGFRIAILYTGLFLVGAVIAGATSYLIIRQELVLRHDRSVEQDYRFFEGIYQAGGRADLIETAKMQAIAARPDDKVILLLDEAGAKLSGNVNPVAGLPKSGEVSAARLGLNGDYDYLVIKRKLGDVTVIVGSSGEDVSEVEEVFFQGAFWAALLLVAISLSGGLALAVRMNGRIREIRHALKEVADGRFDIRMPKSNAGDDIDRLTALVDSTIARLGKAVDINRQITTDIAHDLKTPMNRLRIEIEDALARSEDGLPVTDQLSAMEKETSGILATFDALLRIAQIESGARKARFEPVNLTALLSDVVELYDAHAEETGARLSLEIPADLPTVPGDRELLAQLFANLIDNGLKHGGKTPTIGIIAEADAQEVTVRVADNGPGIPLEDRETVFQRLYRLEKSRTTAGTGLGLSLVKAIADLHDAGITLENAEPGLAVIIRFPGSQPR